MKSIVAMAFAVAVFLLLSLLLALDLPVSSDNAADALVTPTPTPCPRPTPELMEVEPVSSPTRLRSQVITVYLGNGEFVKVSAESGTFTTTGQFDAYTNPATVTVELLNGVTHHLEVMGQVRVITQDGCVYGGYTLWRDRDKHGAPLVIEQQTYRFLIYLPLVLRGYNPDHP